MKINCDITKIVFCGAPSSGKTSVFDALQQRIVCGESEVNLSFVEEAATRLLPRDPQLPRRDPLYFQYQVSLFQYTEEDRGLRALLSRGAAKKIQISDRGLADMYIYLGEDARKITEHSADELLARYDAVLFFDTYRSDRMTDGNEYRLEDRAEQDELEAKTRAIWMRHKTVYRVPTFPTVEERVDYTAKLLNGFLKKEVFSPAFCGNSACIGQS